MALDNFRKVNITLNKANQRVLETQIAKVGDANGRELVVQITNNGIIEDQTGTTLKLNWQHENGKQGSTNFKVIDIKTGRFSVYYPSEMLYKGKVNASIEITSNGQVTNSMTFKIIVQADVFDGEGGIVDGVFISLAEVNKKLDDRETEYVELKERQTSVENQFDAVQQEMTDKDVISAPEIIAARGGLPQLNDRLDATDAQLAQTTQVVSDGKIKLFNTKEPRPLVTFISDDGWKGDYNLMKPLFDQKGIIGCLGIVTNYIGGASYMSLSQINEFKNDGWEILSHSVSHRHLATLTEAQIETELKDSRDILRSLDFDVQSMVLPYSSQNALVRKISKKYYRCTFARGGYAQTVPINTHEMGRVLLGADAVAPNNTLAFYKSKVDEAIEKNGWLVVCTHGNQLDSNSLTILEGLIDYIKSVSVPVVTVKEGLEYFENIFESRDEDTGNFTAIGKNGSVFSSNIIRDQFGIVHPSGFNVDTPISSFERDKMTVTPFNHADAAGFPHGAGVLYTYRDTSNLGDTMSYQMWIPYALRTIQFRRPSGGNWGAWTTIGGAENNTTQIEAVNARTADDLISAFPSGKITHTPIGFGGSSTFPNGRGGLLITNRTYSSDNGFQSQEYQDFGTNRRFYRYVTTGGAWGAWQEVYYRPISITSSVSSRTIAANTAVDVIVPFNAANVGDNILCQPLGDLEAGIMFSCIPHKTGNVKLRLFNTTSSPITIATKDWVLRKMI